ncbi:MAG: DEAD/DEAH box helicase [Candidatus Micrarchaeaceae archaeon]
MDFVERAFNAIKNSKRNVLLKAPTGSGKTEVAIRVMRAFPGRIAYLSPLKALSLQVYQRLKLKDSLYITGDEYLQPQPIRKRVVVTTYEKMDSLLRHDMIKDLSMVIIDEIHNVSTRPAIENVVAYALMNNVRIIAMSATIGGDLASWLDAELIEEKGERKVPLYKYVKYRDIVAGPMQFSKVVSEDPIRYAVENEKPVLIFVRSRWRAYEVQKQIPYDSVVFHGGLGSKARATVLRQILNKEKLVVVSTTALGQGVNLPIWLVYFHDIELPVIVKNKLVAWRWLTKNEFDQIAGRAGRPGFDTEGLVVVNSESNIDFERKIELVFSSPNEEVKGKANMYDFILFSLLFKPLDLDGIKAWLSKSFSLRDDPTEALEMLKGSSLITFDGKYSLTKLGKVLVQSYLDISSAVYYLPQLKNNALTLIARSPQVVNASRGRDMYPLLKAWVSGEPVKTNANFTWHDFKQVLDIANWQAYSLYKICEVTNACDPVPVKKLYDELQWGVPYSWIDLAKAKIPREKIVQLRKMGIQKDEVCEKAKDLVPEYCFF